jgi:hypothetical protein
VAGGGHHIWVGLPFAYNGDETTALEEYGQQVIDRINFARGRILPLLAVNASLVDCNS